MNILLRARYFSTLKAISLVLLLPIAGMLACGDEVFLEDALNPASTSLMTSGDLIVVSGGSVANTATPYPAHQVYLLARRVNLKPHYTQVLHQPSLLCGGQQLTLPAINFT